MRGGAWLVPVDEVYSMMTIRATKEKPLKSEILERRAKDSTGR